MKKHLIAGAVLGMLMPLAAQAAPISWATQSYTIDPNLEVDTPSSQSVLSAGNVDTPLTYTGSVATANGSANADVSIQSNLLPSDSNNYTFVVNASTSYQNNQSSNNLYASAVPVASLRNTFTAATSLLNVDYNIDALVSFGASSRGLLSYQDLSIELLLRNYSNFSQNQTELLVSHHVDNLGNTLGSTYTNTDSGFFSFALTQGDSYELFVNVSPIFYTTGTVNNNFSNSTLNISFSDGSSVTPVPEPETYAMMVAGLMLIGFSVRKKS